MERKTNDESNGGGACTYCGGAGEFRYVYCSFCRRYVNGRFGTLSPIEEAQGLRPPIVTECGHEVFSLPGYESCPTCGGTGSSQTRAA